MTPQTVHIEALFYSPTEPRDAAGKWTRVAGGLEVGPDFVETMTHNGFTKYSAGAGYYKVVPMSGGAEAQYRISNIGGKFTLTTQLRYKTSFGPSSTGTKKDFPTLAEALHYVGGMIEKHGDAKFAYNPAEKRDQKGTSTGGRWSAGGATTASKGSTATGHGTVDNEGGATPKSAGAAMPATQKYEGVRAPGGISPGVHTQADEDTLREQVARAVSLRKCSAYDMACIGRVAEENGMDLLAEHAQHATPANWFSLLADAVPNTEKYKRDLPKDTSGEWDDYDDGSPYITANIGITPNRGEPASNVDVIEDYYKSPRFRAWLSDLRVTTNLNHVQLQDVTHAAGVWKGGIEPSASVWLKGTAAAVRKVATQMGAEYNQDSVMQFVAEPDNGSGGIYTIPGLGESDRDKAIQAMSTHGVEGGRVVSMRDGGYSLEVSDEDGSLWEGVQALAKDLGKDLYPTPGTVTFLNAGTDYNRQSRPKKGRGITHSADGTKVAAFAHWAWFDMLGSKPEKPEPKQQGQQAAPQATDDTQAGPKNEGSTTPKDWGRDQAWADAGLTVNPLPKGTALLHMRGGHLTDAPAKGDSVEVYTEEGEWQKGLVAISGVKEGEMGGPYDGQMVVWVGTESGAALNPPEGQELPATVVRKAGGKSTSIDKRDGSKPVPKGKSTVNSATFSEAWFAVGMGLSKYEESKHPRLQAGTPTSGTKHAGEFAPKPGSGGAPTRQMTNPANLPHLRAKKIKPEEWVASGDPVSKIAAEAKFDPSDAPDYTKWAPPGKEGGDQGKYESGHPTVYGPANEGGEEKGNPYGFTKDTDPERAKQLWIQQTFHATVPEMKQRVLDMYHRGTPENIRKWRNWYFYAHDLADQMAQLTGTTSQQAALAIAAMSPHNEWADPWIKGTPKSYTANQWTAFKVLEFVGKRSNEEIDISGDLLKNLQDMHVVDHEGKYIGEDHFADHGTDVTGVHTIGELPADVVAYAAHEYLHAMDGNVTLAIMAARHSSPEELEGPKTRSFYNNIRFPWVSRDVTNDAFQARILLGHRDLEPEELSFVTDKENPFYFDMTAAVQQAADEVGIMPHEMQAFIWVQEHYEEAMAGGWDGKDVTKRHGYQTNYIKDQERERENRINVLRMQTGEPVIAFGVKGMPRRAASWRGKGLLN